MRERRSRLLGAAVIGAALTFGAAADLGTASPPAGDARAREIAIGDFAFEPRTLTVAAGTVLSWVNEDDAPHTVVGTDPGSPIKSLPLDTGDRYSVTLAQPGTYHYFCSLHPHMTGTVVVD